VCAVDELIERFDDKGLYEKQGQSTCKNRTRKVKHPGLISHARFHSSFGVSIESLPKCEC